MTEKKPIIYLETNRSGNTVYYMFKRGKSKAIKAKEAEKMLDKGEAEMHHGSRFNPIKARYGMSEQRRKAVYICPFDDVETPIAMKMKVTIEPNILCNDAVQLKCGHWMLDDCDPDSGLDKMVLPNKNIKHADNKNFKKAKKVIIK